MIQSLSLFSEGYAPHGNAAAEGILNQLGRPGLDLLSILVRETVQNSWDARISDETTVHFTIAQRSLTATQLNFLHHTVLAEEPEQLKLHEALSAAAVDGMHVLVISDRGTVGLNGPIRADAPDDDTKSRNFANFFFNIGQSKGYQLSGGTYGYGKSILYRASQLRTICVYTRCSTQGQLESRFMAAALQPHEEEGSGYRRYTGRHWWGYRNSRDGIVDPVTGPAADEFALGLGLPPFSGDETGTTCMILLPVLGDCPFTEAMQRISRMLLWYCWPKMITGPQGHVPMQFAVSCEEQPVSIPDPSGYPPLSGFVEAMKLLKASPAGARDSLSRVVPIRSQRPKRHLGQLALTRFREQERKEAISHEADFVPPISGVSCHVALMRNAELVVKYLEGDRSPIGKLEYAGIFIADPAVDASFAKAEPPTHDDWNVKSMTEREDKSIVNVALREIRDELKAFVTPQTTSGRDEELFPLGDFADRLGRMLIGVAGDAAYAEPVQEHMPGSAVRSPVRDADGNAPDGHIVGEKGTGPYFVPIIPDGQDRSNGGNGFPGTHSHLPGRTGEDRPSPTLPVPDSEKYNHGRNGSGGTGSSSSGKIVSGVPWNQEAGNNNQEMVLPSVKGRAKIELLDGGQLALMRDIPVMLTSFRVKHAFNSRSTRVEVEASVLLENGEEENDPPVNRDGPEVLCWIDSTGKERSGSEAVLIPATDTDTWQVAVSLPDDARLRVNLTTREVF